MIQELFDELPSLPPSDPPVDHVAGWAWLVIMVSIAAFELWMIHTHHLTLSQWAQRRTWLKVFGTIGLTYLIFHLFWSR